MKCIIFLVILLSTNKLSRAALDQFIIWNVGQGQWATYSSLTECLHFDMGGEQAPLQAATSECFSKKNYVAFSHWDWDHIGFTTQAKRRLPNLCIFEMPGGKGSEKKTKMLGGLPFCKQKPKIETKRVNTAEMLGKSPNGQSKIFLVAGKILVPGDSTISEERKWIENIKDPQRVLILLLGHHGSKTSTSKELIAHLKALKMAVASARYKRYGHPHSQTINRLKSHASLLKTEDWGHVHWLTRPML